MGACSAYMELLGHIRFEDKKTLAGFLGEVLV